jgi:GGDEF domain-containing protein
MKKYSILYEAPIFYLLLYGIQRIFFSDHPGFYGLSPHPYWAGILLFSFRYGFWAGFASGVVSAIFLLVPMWMFGERYLFEDSSFYIEPGLFVIVGVLTGFGIQSFLNEGFARDKEKLAAKTRETGLQGEVSVRDDIIAELEKRIVTRMSTIVTLYEGARKLEAVRLDELYPAILSFVAKVLDADEAALYVREGGAYELRHQHGWTDDTRWPASFLPGEGLAGRAAMTSKVVTIRDILGEVAASGKAIQTPLMAGPIKPGDAGEPLAVLCIQKMPFLNFTSASINLFAFLIGWANRSVARASYVAGLKAQEIVDPDYGVYSGEYFRLRLEEEFQRSKTYYLPLSVGLVGVEGLFAIGPERGHQILSAVSRLLRESCRRMDVVAVHAEEGIPFAVLLLTASKAQAEAVKSNVLEGFARFGFPDSLKIEFGISSFTPQTRDAAQMVAEAGTQLG